MKWHEQHRARMAAKTLSKHRKALDREPIRETARRMYREQGREIPEALRP
ncbi:hypothetical protein L7H23_01130 [Sphingopyxis sp. BSN-002]|nr:hypothetical protein [Sphingopyxis sp. BSN-002]UKK84736.1 hypothetical protein L7H23_01130 [Sphingopyxis sp. BSN-002]